MKNFSKSWIVGTENVSKDVEKHSKSEPHVRVLKLSKQENLGEENFREEVMNSQISKSFLRLTTGDKNLLLVKFNTTYYVIKKETPFRITLIF